MMRMNFFFSLLLLGLIPNHAFSNGVTAEVAKIVMIRGEARAKNKDGGEIRLLKMNEWVGEGDQLQTSAKSFVKLLFKNKTQLNVGPESKIVVNSFPQGEPGLISLVKGKIRTQVDPDPLKKSNNPEDAKLYIKTKSAAMGIRGTDLESSYNPTTQITTTLTYHGEVAMTQLDPTMPAPANSVQELRESFRNNPTVMISDGQFSGANPQNENVTIPVKISPAQKESLEQNKDFSENSTQNSNSSQGNKNFQSPVPPGVSPQAVANNSSEITNVMESSANTTLPSPTENTGPAPTQVAPPPEGFYDAKTGAFAPPAGGFVDFKTGLYVPPPPGSTFDPNTGVFVPPPTVGNFDPSTGQYVPPEGFVLTAEGKFESQPVEVAGGTTNNQTKEGSAPKAGDSRGTTGANTPPPPPVSAGLNAKEFVPPSTPIIVDPTGVVVNMLPPPPPPSDNTALTTDPTTIIKNTELVRDQNFFQFQQQQFINNTTLLVVPTTNVTFTIDAN